MKPTVVLDTNILVSAVFWNGDSNKIVQMALDKKIAVCISEELIFEFVRILKRDFDISKQEIEDVVQSIILFASLVEPRERVEIVNEDPTDNKVLECATACNASHIVSMDKHLLKLVKFGEIKIVKPEELLKELTDGN